MSVLSTVTRAFQRYGQDLTITQAGTDYTVRALLALMSSADQSTYFDGNESVGLVKPALMVYVPGDDPNAGKLENSLFASDFFGGGTTRPAALGYTVRKIQAVRIAGVVIVYICACD